MYCAILLNSFTMISNISLNLAHMTVLYMPMFYDKKVFYSCSQLKLDMLYLCN